MILFHCEALIWRGDRRLWFKPSSIQCSSAAHCAPARWQERLYTVCVHRQKSSLLPTHTFQFWPQNHSSTRGVQSPWTHPGGHSRSPSEEGSGMLCLPHTLCLWPWLYFPGQRSSELKQQHSHTSFQGEFILLTLIKHPGDWSLGTSLFYSNGQKWCLQWFSISKLNLCCNAENGHSASCFQLSANSCLFIFFGSKNT